MSHNYAKPMTIEQRLARVLGRIPDDWRVVVERPAGGRWRALICDATSEGQWSEPHAEMVDAIEETWRLNRKISA